MRHTRRRVCLHAVLPAPQRCARAKHSVLTLLVFGWKRIHRGAAGVASSKQRDYGGTARTPRTTDPPRDGAVREIRRQALHRADPGHVGADRKLKGGSWRPEVKRRAGSYIEYGRGAFRQKRSPSSCPRDECVGLKETARIFATTGREQE